MAGDEFEIASGDIEGPGEEAVDGSVGGAIGGSSGDTDMDDAVTIAAGDFVAGGAGSDADGDTGVHRTRITAAPSLSRGELEHLFLPVYNPASEGTGGTIGAREQMR